VRFGNIQFSGRRESAGAERGKNSSAVSVLPFPLTAYRAMGAGSGRVDIAIDRDIRPQELRGHRGTVEVGEGPRTVQSREMEINDRPDRPFRNLARMNPTSSM